MGLISDERGWLPEVVARLSPEQQFSLALTSAAGLVVGYSYKRLRRYGWRWNPVSVDDLAADGGAQPSKAQSDAPAGPTPDKKLEPDKYAKHVRWQALRLLIVLSLGYYGLKIGCKNYGNPIEPGWLSLEAKLGEVLGVPIGEWIRSVLPDPPSNVDTPGSNGPAADVSGDSKEL